MHSASKCYAFQAFQFLLVYICYSNGCMAFFRTGFLLVTVVPYMVICIKTVTFFRFQEKLVWQADHAVPQLGTYPSHGYFWIFSTAPIPKTLIWCVKFMICTSQKYILFIIENEKTVKTKTKITILGMCNPPHHMH